MAKKRKGRQGSAKGHIESNVIRWREQLVKKKFRIDEHGHALHPKAPINTFSSEWLAKQLAEIGGKPPIDHSLIPRPDNVTSITKNKGKAIPISGNEAEQIPDKPERLQFDSPPSTVHNPFIKPESSEVKRAGSIAWHNQKTRGERKATTARYNSKGYAPSGLPIIFFTDGHLKPEKPVVYTKVEAPPATASRHWYGQPAANDNSVQVRRVPAADSWAAKMQAHVQWFINNVEVQYWPTDVLNYTTWHANGPVPNTGAISKASRNPEHSADMLNALYEGLEASHRDLDDVLCDTLSKNAILEQELKLTQDELKAERQSNSLLEYDLAMRTGKSPDAVRADIIKPKTPDVPDDADVMLAQFNTFNSFVKCDGLEHAFARYVYGDPRMGDTIREHADMRCKEREDAVFGRTYARNLSKFLFQLGEYARQEYVTFWKNEPLKRAKQRNQNKSGAVRPASAEACAYAAMSRKAKPLTYRSIYYRRLDVTNPLIRPAELNNAMAGALISMVVPARPEYNNPHLVDGDNRDECYVKMRKAAKYAAWWRDHIDQAELRYYEVAHPGQVAAVKLYNKTIDILNTELSPSKRKQRKQRIAELRERNRERDERREQRLEKKAEAKRVKAEKAAARKAYRIAH